MAPKTGIAAPGAAEKQRSPAGRPARVGARSVRDWSLLRFGKARSVSRLMLRRERARRKKELAAGKKAVVLRNVSRGVMRLKSRAEKVEAAEEEEEEEEVGVEETESMLSDASTESPSETPAWDTAAARASTPVRAARNPSPPWQGDACVAIDCEMVGVGAKKNRSILARVAVLGEDGRVILDAHVAPTERVTDYRTRYSGIRARDLVGARPFEGVRHQVAAILRGRILVGHAVHNDLKVLGLPHPPALVRDTAAYGGLRRELAGVLDRYDASQAPSLKKLCEHVLKKRIQVGEHCPVEDAAHTLQLYLRHREVWEAEILQNS